MAKIQSFLIPAFTLSLTLAALICPWVFLTRPPPKGPEPLYLSAALASTSGVAIVLLGAVRRRDILRIANARAVLEGLGRRPLPAARLIAMAGWSLATLYDELAWGQALNACAVLIRLLLRASAVLSATAGLVLAAAALAPGLTGLDVEPARDWPIWLGLAAAVPLWALAEFSLSRRDGAAAPTHEEIRAAISGLGARLGGAGTQLGVAAMTGVEQGLDTVIPLLEQQMRKIAARSSAKGLASPEMGEGSDGQELIEELGR